MQQAPFLRAIRLIFRPKWTDCITIWERFHIFLGCELPRIPALHTQGMSNISPIHGSELRDSLGVSSHRIGQIQPNRKNAILRAVSGTGQTGQRGQKNSAETNSALCEKHRQFANIALGRIRTRLSASTVPSAESFASRLRQRLPGRLSSAPAAARR